MLKRFFVIIIVAFLTSNYFPQEKLSVDPQVKIGKLKNGITYYIRENKKPEKRAQLRLVVNAGSILENDEQKGLAHFTEHMAFNGTKNFKKHELINYLESIGMQFGPEINAYTSFDETVYMLQLPTDSSAVLEKGFLVLEDWAHNISFDPAEVELERGVITEEWRLGRGANSRMMDKQFPVIFHNSLYAKRLPIGDPEVIKNFKLNTLTSFYKDWYRPDLMAVIAVGDFQTEDIEKLIKKHFDKLTAPKQLRKRNIVEVPKHKETLFTIATDKEANYSAVAVYNKHDVKSFENTADYKESLKRNLFYAMLNDRFNELGMKAEPPFMYAGAGSGRLVRSIEVNVLQAVVKEDGIAKGLETLLQEAERARKHGFTESEMSRTKANILSSLEKAVNEKDKTESENLIGEYVSHFLYQNPIPGVEKELEYTKKFFNEITLAEVNKLADDLLVEESRVVVVNSPEKESLKIPTETELSAILKNILNNNITAYEDKVLNAPLVSNLPAKGSITDIKKNEKLDYSEWTLSNGAKVIVKKTNFKNDEIVFSAVSKGGNSLISNEDYINSIYASSFAMESGIGKFSSIELSKLLAGKIASVNPYIGVLQEGLNGYCAPKDLETMMQLIHLSFTEIRYDSSASVSLKNKLTAWIENFKNSPNAVFNDTLKSVLSNYHFRSRPINKEVISTIDPVKSISLLKERINDPADFTFLFVGNVDESKLKEYVNTYIASIPGKNIKENWKDVGVTHPSSKIEKIVHKGIEPKATVVYSFNGKMNFNRKEEHLLESLIDVLNIRLREVLREDKGGTYGVSVNQQMNKYPNPEFLININFGCNPERVDELSKEMFAVIDSIKQFGIGNNILVKVKESQRKSRELRLQENGFWSRMISAYLLADENPEEMLKYPEYVTALTEDDIKKAANTYLSSENYVKGLLLPEKK